MYALGDVLFIQYTGFKHYGIYVGNSTVIHNSKKFFKVEEISLNEFSDNKEPKISSIKSLTPELSIQKAKQYLGVPYSLFSENCEHFVRVVSGLEKESTQLQKYMVSAFCIGVMLRSENKIFKAVSSTTLIGTLLTPSEKSPIKNATILACLAVGIIFLSTRNS